MSSRRSVARDRPSRRHGEGEKRRLYVFEAFALQQLSMGRVGSQHQHSVGQVTNGGVEDKLLPLKVLHRGGWEGEGMGAVCMPSTSAPEDNNTLPLSSHKHRELQ